MVKTAFKLERKRWECDWIDTFISSPYGNFSKIPVKQFLKSIELQVQVDQRENKRRWEMIQVLENKTQMEE